MAATGSAPAKVRKRSISEDADASRDGSFDFEAAHARLSGYRSRLSRLSRESRQAVLEDVGPEVAGLPKAYDR